MGRDSQASYIHLKDSHYALYISNWVHDKLPNEDIEVQGFHVDDDEDEDSTAMQQASFGSLRTHKKNIHHLWKDLDLQKFLKEDSSSIFESQDNTILKKLENLHQFDLQDVEGHTVGSSFDNTVLNQESSHTAALSTFEISTPNVTRNRTSQRNLQNYQTPIGRIMR